MANGLLLFIGTPELIIVMLAVLLLFGSKRIPEFARGLGRGIRQFKDATQDIQDDILDSARSIEREARMKDKKDES
ncbi:MAG: twin-arginine translocase TatA/TatE family subunit [Salibacteraceae bacterium]